ncbi:hypothetical protein [Aeromonas dhakensis]|uniref:hypothetical protein n=1 Tax=Aeromonas dhakensis TaxID=196024 RepID=UPI000AC9B298
MNSLSQVETNIQHKIISNADVSSRRYILMMLSSLSVSILIQFLYYTSNIGLYVGSIADYLSITLLIITLLMAVYWYLQIQPTKYRSLMTTRVDPIEIYSTMLSQIGEISNALELYKNKNTDVNLYSDFIKTRLAGLPSKPEFDNFSSRTLTNDTQLELFKLVMSNLHNELEGKLSGAMQEENNKTNDESASEKSIARLIKLSEHITTRLKHEIELLTKRGNLYISIGSVITIAGGIVLYLTVKDFVQSYVNLTNSNDSINKHDILSITARISIIIFIEIFAYYYLKLYKNIMDNVKFYQNEISNMDLKLLALHAVEINENHEALKNITDELAKTERNFVISKGQTTIDIEKSKHEQSILYKSIDKISNLIKLSK